MKASTLLILAAPGALAAQYNSLNYEAFTDFLIPKPVLVARSGIEARQANSSNPGALIVEQLNIIGNATAAVTDAINGFSLATIFSLQSSSLGLVGIINNAARLVESAPGAIESASDPSVVAITTTVGRLTSTTNASISAAIRQKEVFGGVAPVVLASFQQLQNATTDLTTAINTKLPSTLQDISAQIVAPIFASFAQGIAVFQKPNVNPSSVYAATSMSGAATTLASRVAVGFGLATFGLTYLYL